jgi:hypothetical protein
MERFSWVEEEGKVKVLDDGGVLVEADTLMEAVGELMKMAKDVLAKRMKLDNLAGELQVELSELTRMKEEIAEEDVRRKGL